MIPLICNVQNGQQRDTKQLNVCQKFRKGGEGDDCLMGKEFLPEEIKMFWN